MRTIGFFLLVGLLPVTGCSDLFDPEGDSTVTLDDDSFYEQIGAAIVACAVAIYNQNLAGKPAGTHQITTSGPLGGMVTITGTTSIDQTHDITAVDLSYDLDEVGCSTVFSSADTEWALTLTLTGTLTHKGSFGGISGDYSDETYAGTALHIMASSAYNDDIVRTTDETGDVTIHRQNDHISGVVLGHAISW